MNKILYNTIIFLAITTITMAQSKMTSLYKKLPADKQSSITIKEKAGKFTATSGTGKCKITVNDKNGYLQVIDDGTGGGTFYIELALFKADDGSQTLAYNSYTVSADGIESNGFTFYSLPTMSENTMSVWPDIGYVEDLLTGGVTKEDIEPYKTTEYNVGYLPKTGTNIMFSIGFRSLDEAVANGDAKAKAIKAKLKPVKFVWNKKTAFFDLKK
jgi:hypothetical protein